MAETIGIIAGGGNFPFLVAREARGRGMRVVVAGIHENVDPSLEGEVDAFIVFKIGQVNKVIKFFLRQGATSMVMAGTVNKARALSLRPDFRAAKLIFSLKERGDDALLRAVAREFESEGIRVLKPHQIVPGLLTPEGVLTRTKPGRERMDDIRYAWPLAKEIGRLDIGQTIVAHHGMVVAVEAMEGTNETIRRAGTLVKGFTVVKVFKPGQEDRVDMPSAGLTTIEVMREAGGKCLCVEAGKSLFFDREAALAYADKHGIAVVGASDAFIA